MFIPNEFMNPTIENPGVLSGFTGAVLKASNWYNVKKTRNNFVRFWKVLLSLTIGQETMGVPILNSLPALLEGSIVQLLMLTKVSAL